MNRAKLRIFSRSWLRTGRRLALRLCLGGLPWLAAGCGTPSLLPSASAPSSVALAPLEADPQANCTVRAAPAPAPSKLPPTVTAPQPQPHAVPVSLDAVLRLAEGQNHQIALARERLQQSAAEKDLADYSWLPKVAAGPTYGRHEGGTQNPDGTFVHSSYGNLFGGVDIHSELDLQNATFERINAERKVWQQKGELSKVTNEQMLEATETYIDMLSARTFEGVAPEIDQDLQALLKQTEPLVAEGGKVQVVAIQASQSAHNQAVLKAQQQAKSAAAKLAYLLNLGSGVQLQAVDAWLLPLNLVDTAAPTEALIAQALANGPGIRELEGMLGVVQRGREQAGGFACLLPVFEVHMLEGYWGAGPGDNLDSDNRWDMCVSARWQLTDLCTAKERKRIADSQIQQLNLTYEDLRGKLSAGVQEAHQAILSGREQLVLVEKQVQQAREAYNLSWKRFYGPDKVPGSSANEVLQAIRSLELAQLNKIQVVREYDKAQLRLLLLLGAGGGCH